MNAQQPNAAPAPPAMAAQASVPQGAVELRNLRATSVEHRLGYFGNDRFVLFGYCPGGGEVLWKDGHSYGFGTGGWRFFLEEIAPHAERLGMHLGSPAVAGQCVLLMDRARGTVHAVPRADAEAFLASVYHIPRATRPCLCGLLESDACPSRKADADDRE